jgi:hypothetical protein
MLSDFLFSRTLGLALGPTQIPIQWAAEALSKGHKPDHPSSSSADVKNEWSDTSAPPYAVMACTETALPSCCLN